MSHHEMEGHHSHEQGDMQNEEQNRVMLEYMLHHNTEHCGELNEYEAAYRTQGKDEIADLLAESVRLFDESNHMLAKALEKIGEV